MSEINRRKMLTMRLLKVNPKHAGRKWLDFLLHWEYLRSFPWSPDPSPTQGLLFSYLLLQIWGMIVFLGWEIQGTNLFLHCTVKGCLPELLIRPNGVVLHTGVSKLADSGRQFLWEHTVHVTMGLTESWRFRKLQAPQLTTDVIKGLI